MAVKRCHQLRVGWARACIATLLWAACQAGGAFAQSPQELWSFQPLRSVGLPAQAAEPQARNPVDALVLARLQEAGLSPAPASSRSNWPPMRYEQHATLLYLLGEDHTRLTFRHGGIDRRLTDVHGKVIHEILA